MPTANLTITSIADAGLPNWKANKLYESIGGTVFIKSLIIDDNGNFQLATTGGRAGNITPIWATVLGDTTSDGDVTWTRVRLYDATLTPIPYPATIKSGSTLVLTWSSTDSVQADINGTIVPPNGSAEFTPQLDQFSDQLISFGYDGNETLLRIFQAPAYTLTVTDGFTPVTSTVYFLISSPVDIAEVVCFAPVNVAVPADFGDAHADAVVPPDFPVWEPDTNYPKGIQVLDSNGNGQVSLNEGVSASLAPDWQEIGDDTTETTGKAWQNTGPQYPGTCIQRGFGELWDGGQSTLGFGFDEIVVPELIPDLIPYAINTDFAVGDIASIPLVTNTHSYNGIPIFKCVKAGTTGPTAFWVTNPLNTVVLQGQIFPDGLYNFGGTVVWQFMGYIRLTVNWLGTTIQAPDGYPVGNVATASDSEPYLTTEFDGTIKGSDPLTYTDINSFLTTPADWNPGFFPFETATIPATGEPPDCPTWISVDLGTGIINSTCSDGFEVNVEGTWADFLIPFDEVPLTPPPPNGTIVIIKSTNPPGSEQVFTFNPNWKESFQLTDGQSDSTDVLPGIYSITEDAVEGWTTETSQDISSIEVGSGVVVTIIFYNNQTPVLTGLSLVGDFTEGISHKAIKWDQWTYHNNCRLLSAHTGNDTYVVTILDSGKIIKLDNVQKTDYIDGTTTSPIYHYAITAGFEDVESYLNFLYAIVLRVIGQGLLHVSVMDGDDVFAINPDNQIDCPNVELVLRPGKDIQVPVQFQDEQYYIKFFAQPPDGEPEDDNSYFLISKVNLFHKALYSERPQ